MNAVSMRVESAPEWLRPLLSTVAAIAALVVIVFGFIFAIMFQTVVDTEANTAAGFEQLIFWGAGLAVGAIYTIVNVIAFFSTEVQTTHPYRRFWSAAGRTLYVYPFVAWLLSLAAIPTAVLLAMGFIIPHRLGTPDLFFRLMDDGRVLTSTTIVPASRYRITSVPIGQYQRFPIDYDVKTPGGSVHLQVAMTLELKNNDSFRSLVTGQNEALGEHSDDRTGMQGAFFRQAISPYGWSAARQIVSELQSHKLYGDEADLKVRFAQILSENPSLRPLWANRVIIESVTVPKTSPQYQ